MSGRRIELSATQVIASMLAAVTGAVAASYAGIGGTVIGVAAMSVVSTAGAAVYQHYLGRSKERLRSAAVVIAPVIAPRANINGSAGHRGRGTGAHAQASGGQTRAAGDTARAAGGLARAAGNPDRAAEDQNRAGRQARAPGTAGTAPYPARAAGQFGGWPWSPDSPVTEGFPTISGEAARWSDPPAETGELTGSIDAGNHAAGDRAAGDHAAGDHAARDHAAGDHAAGDHAAGSEEATQRLGGSPGNGADHVGPGADSGHGDPGSGTDGDGPGTGTSRARAGTAGPRGARRRWTAIAAGTIGVFVFALGGITAFEVAAGKPLDALIWGRHGGGTTIGDITGAQHAGSASRPTSPHATPTPSDRPTGSPTPSPSSPAPTPSSTRSPSPAPTRSPSPSPTLSSPAPAPASASPSGSAGR
jgi:hypothetical protein